MPSLASLEEKGNSTSHQQWDLTRSAFLTCLDVAQKNRSAKLTWENLCTFVMSTHMKNKDNLVYLFGDLNASRNDPLHRKYTTNGLGQERLMNNLLNHGGLIDTFNACNPGVQYLTWGNHNTWSPGSHTDFRPCQTTRNCIADLQCHSKAARI